jgi:hypothetical protein
LFADAFDAYICLQMPLTLTPDEDFRTRVKETYEDVLDIAKDGFWVKRDFL